MFKRSCVVLLSLLVLGSAGSARAQSDPSLVGWWTFDEGAGDTAMDSSGNGPNIPLVNTTWEQGWSGTAVHFHRTGYGRDTAFTFTGNAVTLCAWAWHDTFAGNSVERYVTIGGEVAVIRRNGDGRLHFYATIGGSFSHIYVPNVLKEGEWQYVVGTWDGTVQRLYLNGVEIATATPSGNLSAGTMIRLSSPDGEPLNGMLDDVRIYNRALAQREVSNLMDPGGAFKAREPVPADKATDVPQDVILGWTAGRFAATHDVYFGTTFEDVNDAVVAVSAGQTDAAFDPEGLLDFGQTYYWRVDEVNAAPDNTVFKGKTWSFTVEPYSYRLTPVAATASSFQPGMTPTNTINGSGLNAEDQHGTNLQEMWMTAGETPAWIQYEFDKVYKLDKMLVWNSNQAIEGFLGFGAKSVVVETSEDGQTWTVLEGVSEFAKASGAATYTANTTVDFAGAMARFVKITISGNWGGMATQTGLAEVRFFYAPVQAFGPEPADGAVNVRVETSLSWRPGRGTTSHTVYIGADRNAVASGTVSGISVNEHSFSPTGLQLDTEYFWRVDEIGDSDVPAGDVWSFTTEAFAVVDDFESYDDEGNRIYQSWVDGLTDNASGSQVGYDESPFAEKKTVHGGGQSMPLIYNNASFAFSEAKRTFDPAQNWTARGIKSLTIHFAGAAGNGGKLYAKINGTKIAYDGDQANLARSVWQAWNIDLSAIGGVNSVRSLTIGIEGSGATGTLYLDDIRLYPKAPEYLTPADPGKANLVALFALDGNANDSSGKGNNGTITGAAEYVTGAVGQALRFNGTTTFVDCGAGAGLNLTDAFTITAWIQMDFTAGDRKIAGNQDGTTGGYKLGVYTDNKVECEIRTAANAATLNRNVTGGTVMRQGEWYHVAGVYSKEGRFIRTYVFGNLDRELTTTAVLGSSKGTFKLGREPSAGSNFWLGAMDDVEVFNRVLSQEEILWVMGQRTPVAKPF
jgi:hypothetical protein